MGRCSRQHKSGTTYFYRCITAQDVEDIACKNYLDEKYVLEAVRTAFQYQVCLVAEYEKEYGKDFYGNLEKEAAEVNMWKSKWNIRKCRKKHMPH